MAQVSSQEARGNKEYRETPWVASDVALQALDTQLVAAPALPGGSGPVAAAGSVRRVGFNAAGMGIKVRWRETDSSCSYARRRRSFQWTRLHGTGNCWGLGSATPPCSEPLLWGWLHSPDPQLSVPAARSRGSFDATPLLQQT